MHTNLSRVWSDDGGYLHTIVHLDNPTDTVRVVKKGMIAGVIQWVDTEEHL